MPVRIPFQFFFERNEDLEISTEDLPKKPISLRTIIV